MTDSPTTRAATAADIPAIAALHHAALGASGAPGERELAFWREALEFAEPQLVVATVGRSVAGFAGFDRSRDPKSKPTAGEIWALHVAPPFQRQGVATQLLDAAEAGLADEECTLCTVWVRLRDEARLAFFEQAGYKREMTTLRTTAAGGERVEEIRLRHVLG